MEIPRWIFELLQEQEISFKEKKIGWEMRFDKRGNYSLQKTWNVISVILKYMSACKDKKSKLYVQAWISVVYEISERANKMWRRMIGKRNKSEFAGGWGNEEEEVFFFFFSPSSFLSFPLNYLYIWYEIDQMLLLSFFLN